MICVDLHDFVVFSRENCKCIVFYRECYCFLLIRHAFITSINQNLIIYSLISRSPSVSNPLVQIYVDKCGYLIWCLALNSFFVQRELKRFLWCGQIRFCHLPSTANKSTMLGHGLARTDSENIVTNYRLLQRVKVTCEFHRVNIQVHNYVLIFIYKYQF